jgi:hypothetical protein
LDLFFQQIAKYPTRAIVDQFANATISRAILYDPKPEFEFRDGEGILPWDIEINAVLNLFLFGEGYVPEVLFNCPTGNCTFSPFQTLALDFECKEMPSDSLYFGCKNTSAEWLSTVHYRGLGLNPNVTSCGYYMDVPNDMPQLMSGYEITANGSVGEVMATRFFPVTDLITNKQLFGGSINFKGVKNPVVDFVVASTPNGFDGAIRNNTPVVTECEIHWVVKTIEAKISNGNLREEAVETIQFISDLDNPWNPDDPNWYAANFSLTLPDPHSFIGPNSTYGMDNTTARQVWQALTQLAPSTFLRPAASNPVKSGDVLKLEWLESPQRLAVVDQPSLPWDTPANISAQMAGAVAAMNQAVRRNPLSQRDRHDVAVGQAIKYQIYVHVKWEWITFPVTLLLIGLVFLLWTVKRSAKDSPKFGVWKNSTLPVLLNSLNGRTLTGEENNNQRKLGETKKKAKYLSFQF